jgi:hypothetical protein
MSIEAIINYSDEEKVQQFLMLIKDPAVQPVFRLYVENILATSELKILKRLSTLESMLGLDDYGEEDFPSIPEQIQQLSSKIDTIVTEKPVETTPEEPVMIYKTSLERKAVELLNHIQTNVKTRHNDIYMNNAELTYFFKYEISEDLRTNDSNLRRVKKKVIDKAVKMFPECLFISKSKNGRHETILVLKRTCKIGTVQ